MYTAISLALVVSWVFLFFGLFLFERMEHRITALTVQQQQLLRVQQQIAEHLGLQVSDTQLMRQLQELVQDGKTYEAIETYRGVQGVSRREARLFVAQLAARPSSDESGTDSGNGESSAQS